MTGFARFFILMIFLAPIAYIAASYANGQDGIENFKRLIGLSDKKEVLEGEKEQPGIVNLFSGKGKELEQLRQENQALKDSLDAKDLELYELRRQIRLLKGSRQ